MSGRWLRTGVREVPRKHVFLTGVALLGALLAGCGAATSSPPTKPTPSAAASSPQSYGNPTKALCKRSHYVIGYDVFSDTQPFAVLVSQSLKSSAKAIGCATVIQTVDNSSGPVAVANLKTLIAEKIQGFVDFNIIEAYQPPIAAILQKAHIPGVAIIGAALSGAPGVGADNYGSALGAGKYLATVAKKRYPTAVPYVVFGNEPTAGSTIMARYYGAIAGVKSIYRDLPASHIIAVHEDGSEDGAYSAAVDALARVPKGSVVLVTAEDDESTAGVYRAAVSHGGYKILVNSYGGDPFGLHQVCSYPSQYVGAWSLDPTLWGKYALSAIMDRMNGYKVPATLGVDGVEVTRTQLVASHQC